MGLRSEWNQKKAAANIKKHAVSFDEACTVFVDPLACIFDDEDHSHGEVREIIIGHSALGRVLVVSFTERQPISCESSARGWRRIGSGATMRKTKAPKESGRPSDDLRPEYRFDYVKAKSNRFAGQTMEEQVLVLLDPDLSEVFQTPDSVNALLRALIQTMPPGVRDKAEKPESGKGELLTPPPHTT